MRLHRAILALSALALVAGPLGAMADDTFLDELVLSDMSIDTDDTVFFNLDDSVARQLNEETSSDDWIRSLVEDGQYIGDSMDINRTAASLFLRLTNACYACGDVNGIGSDPNTASSTYCKTAVKALLCGDGAFVDTTVSPYNVLSSDQATCQAKIDGLNLASTTDATVSLIGALLEESCDKLPWYDMAHPSTSRLDGLQTRYCMVCADSKGSYNPYAEPGASCRLSLANYVCDPDNSAVRTMIGSKTGKTPSSTYATCLSNIISTTLTPVPLKTGGQNLFNVTFGMCYDNDINYASYLEAQLACESCSTLYDGISATTNPVTTASQTCKDDLSALLCDEMATPQIYGMNIPTTSAFYWSAAATCMTRIGTTFTAGSTAGRVDAAKQIVTVTSSACELVPVASLTGADYLTCNACTGATLSDSCVATAADVMCATGSNDLRETTDTYLTSNFKTILTRTAFVPGAATCVSGIVGQAVGGAQAAAGAVTAASFCATGSETTVYDAICKYVPSATPFAAYNRHLVAQYVCSGISSSTAAGHALAAAFATGYASETACFSAAIGADAAKFDALMACACQTKAAPTCVNTAVTANVAKCSAFRAAAGPLGLGGCTTPPPPSSMPPPPPTTTPVATPPPPTVAHSPPPPASVHSPPPPTTAHSPPPPSTTPRSPPPPSTTRSPPPPPGARSSMPPPPPPSSTTAASPPPPPPEAAAGVVDPTDLGVASTVSLTVSFNVPFSAYQARMASTGSSASDKPDIKTQLSFFTCSVNVRTYNLLVGPTEAKLPQRRCSASDPYNLNGFLALNLNIDYNRWDFFVNAVKNSNGHLTLGDFDANNTHDEYADLARAAATVLGRYYLDPNHVASVYRVPRGWLTIGGRYDQLGGGWDWDYVNDNGPVYANTTVRITPYLVMGTVDMYSGGVSTTGRRRLLQTIVEPVFPVDRPTVPGAVGGFDTVTVSNLKVDGQAPTPKKATDHKARDIGLGVGLGVGIPVVAGGVAAAVVLSKKKKNQGGHQAQAAAPAVI